MLRQWLKGDPSQKDKVKGLKNDIEDLLDKMRQTRHSVIQSVVPEVPVDISHEKAIELVEACIKDCEEGTNKVQAIIESMPVTCEKECDLIAAYHGLYQKVLLLKSQLGGSLPEFEPLKEIGVHLDFFTSLSKCATEQCAIVQRTLADYRPLLDQLEPLRRRLRNVLEDKVGAVRAYVRVRGSSLQVSDTTVQLNCTLQRPTLFEHFNHVFQDEATNSSIALHMQGLFEQLQDGYNLLFFGYGQSGSGKTYSLIGTPNDHGFLARGTFDNPEFMRTVKEWSLETVLELYPAIKSSTAQEKVIVSFGTYSGTHDKEPNRGINRQSDIVAVLGALTPQRQSKKRILVTPFNPQSSRSHLIIVYKFTFLNGNTGRLIVMDLAGNESTNVLFAHPFYSDARKTLKDPSLEYLLTMDPAKSPTSGTNDYIHVLRQSKYINESLGDLAAYLKLRKKGRKPSSDRRLLTKLLREYDLPNEQNKPTKFILFGTINGTTDKDCEQNESTLQFIQSIE